MLSSQRLKGAALTNLRRRPLLRQRAPLSVAMVVALERSALEKDDRDSILSSAILFTLFSRTRVGDMRRSNVEPILDILRASGEGFVDGAFLAHKTARPGTKRAMLVVAPTIGVSGLRWAEAWLQGRRCANLDASVSGTLLPAPALSGGWSTVPMSTCELAVALHELLLKKGFSADQLKDIGSHSLKTTCLSWCAKRGLEQDVRRLLGYHRVPGEQSTAAYSRDEMAGPLRKLAAVLADIRGERFDPDATRSGQLLGLAAGSSTSSPACASPSSSSSFASSSRSLSSGTSKASDDDTEKPEENFEGLVLNTSSGLLHRIAPNNKLECGRYVPINAEFPSERPASARLCRFCF